MDQVSGVGGGSGGLAKRKLSIAAVKSTKKAKIVVAGEAKQISDTARELLELAPEMARAALQKLIKGWVPDPKAPNYQKNSIGFPPAEVTCDGCILVKKAPSVSSLSMGWSRI